MTSDRRILLTLSYSYRFMKVKEFYKKVLFWSYTSDFFYFFCIFFLFFIYNELYTSKCKIIQEDGKICVYVQILKKMF